MALSRGSKWFLGLCVVLALGLGAGLLYLDGRLGGTDVEPGQPVELTVERGESVRSVGDQLSDHGVVRSASRFRSAAADAQLDRHLQPGVYELETGMDAETAVQALLDGPSEPASVRFTIPEGLPVELILERLGEAFDDYEEADFRAVLDERTEAGENAEGVLRLPDWAPEPAEAGEEIIEPYEGLLFPETYEVGLDATPAAVLQRMVDHTGTVMDRVLAETDDDRSPYEILITASVVERETRVDDERPRVAGVIANRLEDGMRLQVDATVLYARGEHVERVLIEDTEIDSPYNTYQASGLPPAPIAAPGEASLRATVQPEEHEYHFYVLAPECDGSHQFAEDESGHQANVAEFRDAGRCL
jgi:UPF0755 protein